MKNSNYKLLKIIPFLCYSLFCFFVMSCNSKPAEQVSTLPAQVSITPTDTKTDTIAIVTQDTVATVATAAAAIVPVQVDYARYDEQGYFALDYPKGFTIKEKEMKYKGEADPYASNRAYFFSSPEGDITFFAYPAYDKTVNEGIELDKYKEVLISDKKEGKEKRVYLLHAKDKSYERTYTETNGNIMGVQYKDAATLARYQAVFQKFMESLEVYTD